MSLQASKLPPYLHVALVRAMRDQGFNEFAVPFGRLAIYVVLGAVAGVVAAVFPARRGARLNVLEAIAAE